MCLSAANALLRSLNCSDCTSILSSLEAAQTDKLFGVLSNVTCGGPMVPALDDEARAVSNGVSHSSIFHWSFSGFVYEGEIGGCESPRSARLFMRAAFIAESVVRLFLFCNSR